MACPGFAKPLSDALRSNPRGTSVLIGFSNVIAFGLTGATLGIAHPVLAVPALLTTLAEGCDAPSTLQSMARQASLGCSIIVVSCTAATVLAAASIVAIPAAAPIAGIGAVAGVLSEVFARLGEGKSPTNGMINSLLEGLKRFEGMPTKEITEIQKWLALAAGDAKKGSPMSYWMKRDAVDPLKVAITNAVASDPNQDFRAVIMAALPPLVAKANASMSANAGTNNKEYLDAAEGMNYLNRMSSTPVTKWNHQQAIAAIKNPDTAPAAPASASNLLRYIAGAVIVIGVGFAAYKVYNARK